MSNDLPSKEEYEAALKEVDESWDNDSPEVVDRRDVLIDIIVRYEEFYFSFL